MALSRSDKPKTADVSKKLESFSAAVKATPKEEEKIDKKILMSMRIDAKKKQELKSYFSAHGMSLSNGLIAAANFLMLQEEMGKVYISDGIVVERK